MSTASRTLLEVAIHSVRPVLFQTDLEDFQYATDGGTLFIVSYRGRPYGVTCNHVMKSFGYDDLAIFGSFNFAKGAAGANIKGYYRHGSSASNTDNTEGADVRDICIIVFADEVDLAFFGSDIYPIEENTTRSSEQGHVVHVSGFLKDKSFIAPPIIRMSHARLSMRDMGTTSFDPFLRSARMIDPFANFDSVTGLSGSPVFDASGNAMCGMVVRGGIKNGICWLYYLDIFDIEKMLEVAHARGDTIRYDRPAMKR
jgi:hypothetical protein